MRATPCLCWPKPGAQRDGSNASARHGRALYAADARAQLAIADDDPQAVDLLSSAAAHYDRIDMQLRAATARYRLGAVIGGVNGRALQAASVSQMQSLGILDPEGMVRLFMPIEAPLTRARATG